MVLVVDIGNTRIKWARLEGGRLGRSRAAVHSSWRAGDYDRRLFGSGAPIDAVVVSSVAGARVNRALAAAARRAGAKLERVRVGRRGAGVTVGYLEPWRLGVDRFVAAVGAHHLFRGVPVMVVGVGTAMTLDLVDARGRHRGGAIIPAPSLMIDTLFTRTDGIRRRSQGGGAGGRGLFARSTRAGVVEGARYAAAALVDRAAEEARVLLGRQPLVVLSGGGAPLIRGLIESHCVGVPDLVLKGLAQLGGSRALKGRR